eukprot:gene6498-1159_t
MLGILALWNNQTTRGFNASSPLYPRLPDAPAAAALEQVTMTIIIMGAEGANGQQVLLVSSLSGPEQGGQPVPECPGQSSYCDTTRQVRGTGTLSRFTHEAAQVGIPMTPDQGTADPSVYICWKASSRSCFVPIEPFLTSSQRNLLESPTVPPLSIEAHITCNDGIRNADEVEVDCGGSCPYTCPSSTSSSDASMILGIILGSLLALCCAICLVAVLAWALAQARQVEEEEQPAVVEVPAYPAVLPVVSVLTKSSLIFPEAVAASPSGM